jgi:hypothetical protein
MTTTAPAPAGLRTQALDSLRRKREFKEHLLAYVLVNGTIVAIWAVIALTSGFHFPWPIFPILGWGIGLAFHAYSVYGERPFTEADVERELERLRRA